MKHRYKYILFLSIMLAYLHQPAAAQGSKPLTLQQAIELGLKNSNQLKNNKAIIDEASATIKELMDSRLPEVGFTGGYMYFPISPDIKMNMKTSPDSGGGGSQGKVSQAVYGMASVSMPIYAGGKIKYGLESAKLLEKAAMLDADNNREAVVFNTIDAFANLYKAKAALSITKESLEQSRQRVADFSNLEKNGLLARNDLLKAELQASNTELAVLDAESNWKLANVNMNIMLGLPKQTELIPDSSGIAANMAIKSIDEYEQLAEINRKDMEALKMRTMAAAANVKSARGDYFPSIALTGGYAAADIPNLLSAYNIINVGVGVKYSLSSLWKTDAKVQKAKAVENQLVANEAMLSDNVQMQVNKAYQQYLVSKKKIEVYAKAVEQAAENYKITKNKYDNSLATTTDLLDADVAQLQAKLNYEFSKTDAMVAYSRLQQTAGILIDNNK